MTSFNSGVRINNFVMKIKITSICILSILLINISSCKIDNVQPETKSGYFILTQLSKDASLEEAVADARLKAGDVDFSLGNLKAIREFYFL